MPRNYRGVLNNLEVEDEKKSLGRRIAEAFINPFTAILIAQALVSAATDMIFPALSLLRNSPEAFDPLTVIIILTMVLLSGTLRFVQESRSGNAMESQKATGSRHFCLPFQLQ